MTPAEAWRWAPGIALLLGATMTIGVDTQRPMPLRAPLNEEISARIGDYRAEDIQLSDAEIRGAGVTTYLMRQYVPAAEAGGSGFSVYVGYYDSQTQGKTIHSPKNCLPGAGWEALASRRAEITTAGGPVAVNRYLLQRDEQKALVVYWYQGRGRVQANEYVVKADLLRDAALRGRTEEALVRIVVPVVTTEEEAFRLAVRVAGTIVPQVERALPAA